MMNWLLKMPPQYQYTLAQKDGVWSILNSWFMQNQLFSDFLFLCRENKGKRCSIKCNPVTFIRYWHREGNWNCVEHNWWKWFNFIWGNFLPPPSLSDYTSSDGWRIWDLCPMWWARVHYLQWLNEACLRRNKWTVIRLCSSNTFKQERKENRRTRQRRWTLGTKPSR